MPLTKPHPKGPDKKHDCFACVIRYNAMTSAPEIRCRILTEGIISCPFYKTVDEFKKGVPHERRK